MDTLLPDRLSSAVYNIYSESYASDEDMQVIDSTINKIERNGIQKNELTAIYLLWTYPKATRDVLLLGERVSKLEELLLNSDYKICTEHPIKYSRTRGAPKDKYVLKAAELGLDHKKVAIAIKAYHYMLNSKEFSDEEITEFFQFILDRGRSDFHKWLILSSLKLTEIPAGILKIKGIKRLSLGRNPIVKLPTDLSGLRDIKYLNLEGTKIEELPKGIEALINLEELYMDCSKLKRVPKEIGKLSKLKKVSFNESRLEDLPDEISNLEHLEGIGARFTPLYNNSKRVEELRKLGCNL